MKTQMEKRAHFSRPARLRRSIHSNPGTPDRRMLERLGFKALATTSAGYAFLGRGSGRRCGSRRDVGASDAIAVASDLPVSADLANGFGMRWPGYRGNHHPACSGGGRGGWIVQDATGRSDDPIYEIKHAVEQDRGGCRAARAAILVHADYARENYLHELDLKDAFSVYSFINRQAPMCCTRRGSRAGRYRHDIEIRPIVL